MTNYSIKIKEDLDKLALLGTEILMDLFYQAKTEKKEKFDEKQNKDKDKYHDKFLNYYQNWYSEASIFIKQMLPDRHKEFCHLYLGDEKRKIDLSTYTIRDFVNGMTLTNPNHSSLSVVVMRLQTQVNILESAKSKFSSTLYDIKQMVQADLLDSELDGAKELLKSKYFRASGIICGVVLESHLKIICDSRGLSLKKNTSISDYNKALKDANIIETPAWRNIQHLADIRNICGHAKGREPKQDEVEDLISGVEKITKTIF